MTPIAYYHSHCLTGQITEDKQQLRALQHLEKVYQDLLKETLRRAGLFAVLRKPKLVKGFYLWGGVGIGKTFLMDCFYHSLPFIKKRRMHFHQFMSYVHAELKKQQGKKDPLQCIADELAEQTLVLCFDEFYVSDITDAMLLGRLLEALFSRGVCLVATANVAPDELYKNGLQRQHFLPTIALLKKKVEIFHLKGEVDYRLRHLKHAGVFYIPNDEAAQDNLEKSFSLLTNNTSVSTAGIELYDRSIPVIKRAKEVIWFDFKVICGVPRSQEDYLALVKKYSTILISNVPILPANSRDKISLFIKLVDVLYDARIRLVLSAEGTMDKIYSEGRLRFEYTRTLSRLIEMQSETYFLK
ncbi:MAG TPA: cell division protein ZapE [Gammaproteobacteria bacterium]|nr:cell division protein ZapE [Gammaproteobacteria bacterium]